MYFLATSLHLIRLLKKYENKRIESVDKKLLNHQTLNELLSNLKQYSICLRNVVMF